MLQTWIHRVRPGKEPRLREWLSYLNSRPEDIRKSFAASGVRAEQAFIVPDSAEGALLVYVSEAADQQQSARAFEESTLELDLEHRRVMDECLEPTMDVPPVYDVVG
jgi:hypothetical protein